MGKLLMTAWSNNVETDQLSIWKKIGLAILSGLLLGGYGAFFHKASQLYLLAFIAFIPLLSCLVDRKGQLRVSSGFGYGFITGLFAIGCGFYWIVDFLLVFGRLTYAVSIPIYLLFVSYHAILFGLFSGLLVWFKKQTKVSLPLLAALCWTCCEFLFPCVFPWYLSMGQLNFISILQIAELTGPVGIGCCIVLVNAALLDLCYAVYNKKFDFSSLRPFGVTLIILLGVFIYGTVRIWQVGEQMKTAPSLQVGIVQGNIGVGLRTGSNWQSWQEQVYKEESKKLVSQGAQLLIWPESSYLKRVIRPPYTDGESFIKLQQDLQTPLVMGSWSQDLVSHKIFNTALHLDSTGRLLSMSDKNYLLIFGEYYPFAAKFPELKEWLPEISLFTKGTEVKPFMFSTDEQTYRLSPLICYEDIQPYFVRRLFSVENRPDLLINLTNESWFGDTVEPYQHLALAALRTVENRSYMVRSVGTGISAVINPLGQLEHKTPVSVVNSREEHQGAVSLLAKVGLMHGKPLAPLEGFGVICCIILICLAILVFYRSKKPIKFSWLFFSFILLIFIFIFIGSLISQGGLKSFWDVLVCNPLLNFGEEVQFSIFMTQQIIYWSTAALLGILWARITNFNILKTMRFPFVLQTQAVFLVFMFVPPWLWGDISGSTPLLIVSFLISSFLIWIFSLLGVIQRRAD